jgi:hypothetical protein
MLGIHNGQLNCVLDCLPSARFDDGRIERYSATGSDSGNTTVASIDAPAEFFDKLKMARRLVIEGPVFERGQARVEFSVANLRWPSNVNRLEGKRPIKAK